MYIDFEYYSDTFRGTPMAEGEFAQIAQRACQILDLASFQRIRLRGFSNLTDFEQRQVRLAAAVQTEFLYENGGVSFLADLGDRSVSLGKFSISAGRTKNTPEAVLNALSPIARAHLANTGLLFAGAGLCM